MTSLLHRRPTPSVRDKLALLLQSQYWPLEKLRAFQWEKLRRLVAHAYTTVPYYRSLFDSLALRPEAVKSPEDFARIPVLSKREIQDSFRALLSTTADTMSIELNSTGGSTGVPLNFYQDRNYKDWAAAATIRTWRHYVNCAPTDLEAVFWGAIRDIGKGFRLHNELHRILRDRVLLLNTFDLDSTLLRRYLFFYNLISPPLVRGYASSLHYVAEFVETHALKLHVPRAVISSTEVLHSRMRTTIERVFRAPVFDSYGCREVSQIATECNHHDGLHISVENQYVELVENDLVITNLNNYAMPLIRYRVGDLASAITTDPCRCGRTLPRIVKLIGRDNDNIELPTGKVINGEFFEFLFFGMTTVIQYQVVYSKSDQKMTVKLHLRDTTENIPALVRSRMKESFGFDNVEIVETDVFDRTPTGKLRFVFTVD